MRQSNKLQRIGVLVFEDVEELDFVGPMEVFGAASLMGASCTLHLVAPTIYPVRCRWGMRVIPDLPIWRETGRTGNSDHNT